MFEFFSTPCNFLRPLVVNHILTKKLPYILKDGNLYFTCISKSRGEKFVHFVDRNLRLLAAFRPVMASHCNRIFTASSINWRRSSHWPDTAAALPNAFNATRSGSKCLNKSFFIIAQGVSCTSYTKHGRRNQLQVNWQMLASNDMLMDSKITKLIDLK